MGDDRASGTRCSTRSGQPCRVDYTSPVFQDHRCYRVVFDDGSELVADAGHRWLAYDLPGWRAHRSRSLLPGQDTGPAVRCGSDHGGDANRGRPPPRRPRKWHIPLAGQIELPEVELPIDPYVLGCRLANGTRTHIPVPYLRASFKQRLALLQGLMDIAGTVVNGSVELRLPDRALLEQVRELACSLGHKAPLPERRTVPVPGGGASAMWRLRWTAPDPVFRLEHKAALVPAITATRTDGRHTRRAIVAIEEIATVPVRCISVSSPSHLFLAGRSMIPTHNTSFALGIVSHAAVHANTPVLLFSLEMSHLELTQRMLCSEARVDASRIRNGRLLESDWPKISDAIGRLGEAPIYIDDNPNVTVMDIRAKARRLKARSGLGLVVVDYLQLMSGHGRSRAENRQVEVSEISRGLKVLARELDIPVIALSQLSRNLEMRQDKRPVLADLRESGSIEQDADVVLFIYRDDVYNPESPDRGTAEIIISKHRNGPTGKIDLAFVDHYTRFADMARV